MHTVLNAPTWAKKQVANTPFPIALSVTQASFMSFQDNERTLDGAEYTVGGFIPQFSIDAFV